jgi:hypothetical protein
MPKSILNKRDLEEVSERLQFFKLLQRGKIKIKKQRFAFAKRCL